MQKLENGQVYIYLAALALAAFTGFLFPEAQSPFEHMMPAILGILMFSMFLQIPFASLKESFANRRFFYALCVVNYIAVPIVVWVLTWFLPDNPTLLLGVLLVLLTPCIDYVIVFTALGKGDEKAMLSATPFLFVSQMLLLPLYLWLFLGAEAAHVVEAGPFVEAFMTLILLPLVVAVGVQRMSKKDGPVLRFSAWLPVPFMALTLFVIVASQIGKLSGSIEWIVKIIPLYIAFMAVMPIIAREIGKRFSLDARTGRALIFSGSTRNSLVVLPLALSLPSDIRTLVVAIIVTQTIVEMIGELLYIRIIPKLIWHDD